MSRRRRHPAFFAALILLPLLLYGLFEARRLLEGPQLTITSPTPGSATGSAVWVAGSAANIAFLTINGKQAFINEEGHFQELLSPSPGYTVFTVAATDRFGRSISKTVPITTLNYCPLSQHA